MKTVFSLLFLAGLLASCTETPNTKEIATIDSLLVELDAAATLLSNIDTSNFATLNQNMSTKSNFIVSAYTQRGDTMNRETALLLADFRDMRKPLKNYKSTLAEVETELKFTKEQLQNLRNDLENNLHDSIRVRKFMETEVDAANAILARPAMLANGVSRTKANAKLYEPKIDSVIAVLKTQP